MPVSVLAPVWFSATLLTLLSSLREAFQTCGNDSERELLIANLKAGPSKKCVSAYTEICNYTDVSLNTLSLQEAGDKGWTSCM